MADLAQSKPFKDENMSTILVEADDYLYGPFTSIEEANDWIERKQPKKAYRRILNSPETEEGLEADFAHALVWKEGWL